MGESTIRVARTKAETAVLYVLRRIQTDANTRWYMGPGTQAFYLLCQAEAEITGEPLEKIERERGTFLRPHDAVADVERYRERVRHLEEHGVEDGEKED